MSEVPLYRSRGTAAERPTLLACKDPRPHVWSMCASTSEFLNTSEFPTELPIHSAGRGRLGQHDRPYTFVSLNLMGVDFWDCLPSGLAQVGQEVTHLLLLLRKAACTGHARASVCGLVGPAQCEAWGKQRV